MAVIGKSLSGNKISKLEIAGIQFIKKEYSRERAFRREKATIESLYGKVSFKIPQIIETGQTDFGPSLTLSWIDGLPLSFGTQYSDEQVCVKIGKAIRELEDIGKGVNSHEHSNAFSFCPDSIGEYIERLPPKFDKKLIRDLLDDAILSELRRETAVLNHRDLRGDNILWDASTKSLGIIDFETACLGPRGSDFGRMFFQDFSDPRTANKILEGYAGSFLSSERLAALELLFAVEMLGYLMMAREQGTPNPDDEDMIRRTGDIIEKICGMEKGMEAPSAHAPPSPCPRAADGLRANLSRQNSRSG